MKRRTRSRSACSCGVGSRVDGAVVDVSAVGCARVVGADHAGRVSEGRRHLSVSRAAARVGDHGRQRHARAGRGARRPRSFLARPSRQRGAGLAAADRRRLRDAGAHRRASHALPTRQMRLCRCRPSTGRRNLSTAFRSASRTSVGSISSSARRYIPKVDRSNDVSLEPDTSGQVWLWRARRHSSGIDRAPGVSVTFLKRDLPMLD